LRRHVLAGIALLLAAPAAASTPASFRALDRASAAACIRASGLADAEVGPPIRFSDRMLMDARSVTGRARQPHMTGARLTMLCLYNRRTRVAEAVEQPASTPATTALRDRWWRVEDIQGRGVVDRSEITLYLGSDGRIAGRSGCNNYSARYSLDGDRLRIFPPLIGTRMACAPALMAQEQRFQTLLERAARVEIDPSGALVLVTSGRDRIRARPGGDSGAGGAR
jgi:heat shock protein HslJ